MLRTSALEGMAWDAQETHAFPERRVGYPRMSPLEMDAYI